MQKRLLNFFHSKYKEIFLQLISLFCMGVISQWYTKWSRNLGGAYSVLTFLFDADTIFWSHKWLSMCRREAEKSQFLAREMRCLLEPLQNLERAQYQNYYVENHKQSLNIYSFYISKLWVSFFFFWLSHGNKLFKAVDYVVSTWDRIQEPSWWQILWDRPWMLRELAGCHATRLVLSVLVAVFHNQGDHTHCQQ